jgi:hypothetical protein
VGNLGWIMQYCKYPALAVEKESLGMEQESCVCTYNMMQDVSTSRRRRGEYYH